MLGGEEQTIKVASKKDTKIGPIKLKKKAPKHKLPGNWMEDSIVDGMSIKSKLKEDYFED